MEKGLRQGFPLSPLFIEIMVVGKRETGRVLLLSLAVGFDGSYT